MQFVMCSSALSNMLPWLPRRRLPVWCPVPIPVPQTSCFHTGAVVTLLPWMSVLSHHFSAPDTSRRCLLTWPCPSCWRPAKDVLQFPSLSVSQGGFPPHCRGDLGVVVSRRHHHHLFHWSSSWPAAELHRPC